MTLVTGKKCQLTGKSPSRGRSYAIRGIAKKKKGIGLKTTGITKRTFKPNVKKKRVWVPEEKRFVTLKLSTSAIRTLSKKGADKVVSEIRSKGYRL